jgi:hypothetical protein
MKSLTFALLALACAATAAPARAQSADSAAAPTGPVTDAQVQTAIDYGKAHPNINLGLPLGKWHRRCRNSDHHNDECGYQIALQGPLGRVITAASTHAGLYLPFTLDSVTAEMRRPVVTVWVAPIAPEFVSGEWRQSPPVQRIVLQVKPARGSEAPGQVIQPGQVQALPMQWTNALGGVFSGQGAVATFDATQIPTTEFDVVLVTGGREIRSTVTARDLEQSGSALH